MSARGRVPGRGMGPEATVPAPSHQEIERRAFRIFRERCAEEGHDLQHWLQADKELLDGIRRAAASPAGA